MSIFSENYQAFSDAGYSVIPLDPCSKKPAIKNWSVFCEIKPTSVQLGAWAQDFLDAGIGVCCGPASGIVCVDVDLYLDQAADKAVYDKIKPLIPSSPVEKFGEKGFTRFVRYGGQETTRIKHQGNVILEILSTGSFTVLPPSIHPDTSQPYCWKGTTSLERISPNDLPALGQDVIDKIKKVIASIVPSGNTPDTTGRNENLKAQVVAAIARGKDDATIIDEIISYDKKHHHVPLFSDSSDPQMNRSSVHENAERFVQSIRNSVEKNERGMPRSLEVQSLSDVFQMQEEQIQWTVDGFLPSAGTSILAAKPKTGKTTLSRQLALAVARGEPFFGRSVMKGLVLYIALEQKLSEVKRHFLDLGGKESDQIVICTTISGGDQIELLSRYIREQKPALVIIDPIFRFIKISDGNNYNAVYAALEPFCTLARTSGAHIMMIHHRGKGEKSGGDSFLGSTAIFAAVDTAITMNKTAQHRTIKSEQRYGVDLEETILVFNPDRRSMCFGETKAQLVSESVGIQILDVLKSACSPVSEEHIEKLIGASTGIFRKTLRGLHTDKRINRSGKGKKGDPYLYSALAGTVGLVEEADCA